jgi:hypothetical protein
MANEGKEGVEDENLSSIGSVLVECVMKILSLDMPKVYEYLGLIFFFYANEHLPIHVHVSFAEFESKIELEYENGVLKKANVREIKGRLPLPEGELKSALKFVKKYHLGIVEKWTDFFVKNKKVKCEVITQKIK